jgi:hypothetical protein
MKNIKRIAFLIAATALATAGLSAQAEQVSKKVLPDMSSQSQGSISLSIWCATGNGNK